MVEEFTPISHSAPDSFFNWLKFRARLLADFQVRTVYKDMTKFLPRVKGRVLDIGCGQSPYKHLFVSKGIEYIGIDIIDAQNFGYFRNDIITFDGVHIPFEDGSFDAIICTEVLEHTPHPESLVLEMYRVLKDDGVGFVTVPWSARTHYMPHDYHRFTPTRLALFFRHFSYADILVRGNDINTICAKIIVVYLRQVSKLLKKQFFLWPLILCICAIGAPLAMLALVLGHLSLLFNVGSKSDPLGYSVVLVK